MMQAAKDSKSPRKMKKSASSKAVKITYKSPTRDKTDLKNFVFLIFNGIVRYECMNNPYLKIDYQRKNMLGGVS